ncbi:MAG: hypothetical protein IJ731_06145 [Eubacterium sp.]|nr:hypothetical protein [Eubacterium sp.]
MKKYKVYFSGYALVEAENTQQAESRFESEQDYFRETIIDSVELQNEGEKIKW